MAHEHKQEKEKENPDVFYIDSMRATHKRHKPEDDLYLDSYTGHNWGERLSFTVGVSYILGKIL
jgi:hypothetical protein